MKIVIFECTVGGQLLLSMKSGLEAVVFVRGLLCIFLVEVFNRFKLRQHPIKFWLPKQNGLCGHNHHNGPLL